MPHVNKISRFKITFQQPGHISRSKKRFTIPQDKQFECVGHVQPDKNGIPQLVLVSRDPPTPSANIFPPVYTAVEPGDDIIPKVS